MKKALSLVMAASLALSCSAVAFADGHSTLVKHVGTGTSEWELTVPELLAPSESGNVLLEGTWDSVTTVNVAADPTVTLTNDIDSSTKVLDITFEGINQVGNMDNSISVTKSIGVAAMDGGIFGTWEGIFNYNVTVDSEDGGLAGVEKELAEFSYGCGACGTSENYTYEVGMTWEEWLDSEYAIDSHFSVYENSIICEESGCYVCSPDGLETMTLNHLVGNCSTT